MKRANQRSESSSVRLRSYLSAGILALAVGGYLAIAGSTVGFTTVQYDEFVDLQIASSLYESPLIGSSSDASQARLAMYATAIAQAIMQHANPDLDLLDLLPTSRWISIAMTVLAILGTAVLGYRLFSIEAGLLASALFAFSPYTLHFGRDALTQGDAFTATTVVWALIAFERFERKRDTFRLACLSLALGLAVTTKFFLVVLVPAFIAYHILIDVHNGLPMLRDISTAAIARDRRSTPWRYILLAVCTGSLAMLIWVCSLLRSRVEPAIAVMMYQASKLIWLGALLGIFLSLAGALDDLGGQRLRLIQPETRWRSVHAWMAILPLALAASLTLCPTHAFNANISIRLAQRIFTWDGHGLFSGTGAAARLYLGLVLFKLGLPLGVLTCAALAWAAIESVRSRPMLMLTMVLVAYGALLAILPLQQPFWLMSVYPIIVVVLAAVIVNVTRSLENVTLRISWVGCVAIACGWLVVGLFRVYPTFGYFGYETVGNRWLGTESRGYRSLVVVTNDGSTEAIDWLRQNAAAGSIVLSYLDDLHIINHLEMKEPFQFEIRHALRLGDRQDLGEAMDGADIVVVRLIGEGGPPSPASDPVFIREFGSEPVYQVVRGRGVYRMPVIMIHQRLQSGG